MTKRRSHSERLTEYTIALGSDGAQVDREKGIISNVKLIGLNSKNGRRYAESALERAIGLYEGAKVNVNHRDPKDNGGRSYQDRIGKVTGVYLREGDGLYAKQFHYNPKHAIAEQLAWDAENNPSAVGFSHDADGKTSRKAGVLVVEDILKVHSVDLVADPATTTSLHESEGTMFKTTIKKLIEATGYKHTQRLLEMLPGEVAPEEEMEMEPEVEKADPVTAVKAALADEAIKIFLDPDIDPVETGKKIKDLAKAADDVANKVNPAEPEPEAPAEESSEESSDDEEEKVPESWVKRFSALENTVKLGEKRTEAINALTQEGIAPKAELVNELMECEAEKMQDRIHGWTPQKRGLAKPSIKRVMEDVGSFPTDHKSFMRALRR